MNSLANRLYYYIFILLYITGIRESAKSFYPSYQLKLLPLRSLKFPPEQHYFLLEDCNRQLLLFEDFIPLKITFNKQ